MVPLGERILKPLQEHYAGAIPKTVPVRLGVKGAGTALRGKTIAPSWAR